MKFHNIGMVGPFVNQKLTNLPNPFDQTRDQGRLIWLTDGTLWYGTDSEWKQIGNAENQADDPTGLERIEEGGIFGWRLIGQDVDNHGTIGTNAVDMSISYNVSNIIGALGDGSFSTGIGTISQNTGSFSTGQYNVGTSTNTIFEVGVGTDDAHRLNVLEIYRDGTITAPESLISNIDIMGDKSLTTKEYVVSLISTIGGATGLERITEGASSGWRLIGQDVDNHGTIGTDAVDMTISTESNNVIGATGTNSFSTGLGTISQNTGSFSAGRYNLGIYLDTVLEVGIGSSNSLRSNALEIYSDGRIYAPQLNSIVNDKSLTTKEYVDDKVDSSSISTGFVLISVTEVVPNGYLECDGHDVSRTTYSDLFGIIGSMYGDGDGSTTFTLPDFRGMFLRGWDHGSNNDPDAANRTDRGDGTLGDEVGTKQSDELIDHNHIIKTASESTGGGYIKRCGFIGNPLQDVGIESTGGLETRPKNINVMYCIKY